VARSDGGEGPAIEGDDDRSLEPFRESDRRGVCPAEREVRVLLDELGHSDEVLRARALDVERAESAEETRLSDRAESAGDEVRRLRDDEGRDDQP
jgi:hypothetical protein